jgi:hypothetical protein
MCRTPFSPADGRPPQLRRTLLEKDELPESSLVTAMAIAVHADSDRHQHDANQIAVTRVPLGTNIADPVARLRTVHRRNRNQCRDPAGSATRNAISAH